MDSTDPQGSPGVNHEDGVAGPILTSVETVTDLDSWTTSSELSDVQKDASSSSRLLFLTVEYVEEQDADYGRSAFAGFEPGTPFSPQQPASLSEFEHRVSPLDPNMGSTTRYSPVYTMNGNTDPLNVTKEISPSNTTVSSNPTSPFPSQVVVLTNPSSPLMNSASNTLQSPHFTDTSHDHSPSSNTVTSGEITQGFVNHILSNSVASPVTCSSSTTDAGDGLLERVVNDENYFHSTNTVLPSDLSGSPLDSNSRHSPIHTPLTTADSFVVASSAETLDAIRSRPSSFHSNVNVSVANSPSVVDSASDMIIHSSNIQQANEVVGVTETPFHNLNPAEVLTSTANIQLKPDALDRVQLLISSSDGSIAYSLDGQTSFMQTRIVDMGNELLSHCTSEEQHLNSVINSFKMQGIVLGQGENGDLQLRPSQPEVDSDDKIDGTGTLGLRELTFAMRHQQNELLQQTLLAAPLNGDLTDSVARLSESLLNDVKISIVDQSLEAVGAYNDILMEAACVADVIENNISNNTLAQESPEICPDFDSPSIGKIKEKLESFSSSIISSPSPNPLPDKTLDGEDISSSLNRECSSNFLPHEALVSAAAITLPSAYLALGKLPRKKSEDPFYGVFARKTIPKGTQFGPIQGTLMDISEFLIEHEQKKTNQQLIFMVETECGAVKKLNISYENSSNWANFVRIASCFKEQNLILSQQEQSLFFITTKTIQPRQELRVWYSLPYAKKHGLPVLQPLKFYLQDCGDSLNNWSCFKCKENFNNSMELQCHLNTHEFDESREICVYHCQYCNHSFTRNCNVKKLQDMNSNGRKYLCEVCGHQFSHIHNSDCHVRRIPKDSEVDTLEHLLLSKKKIMSMDTENCKKRNKTEWYCSHCNFTFDNPSICNLHTLAHAAENLKETEVSYLQEKNMESKDLRCPKCTKRMETSNITVTAFGLTKPILSSSHKNVQFNALDNETILLNSNDSSMNFHVNGKSNFMENRVMDIDASEFLPSSPSTDHQLNSVLNSFKMEDDKLTSNLDLQDLALTVRQPQHDLLEQTILDTPLNGDLTENVQFNHYDDVKISIVDPSLEAVGTYSDILIQSACVENVIDNELTVNSVNHEPTQLCSNFETSVNNSDDKIATAVGDDCVVNSFDINTSGFNGLKSGLKDKLGVTSELTSSPSRSLRMKKNSKRTRKCIYKGLKPVLKRKLGVKKLSSSTANYLSIKKVSKTTTESDYGVFARKTIPNHTRFGPLKGVLMDCVDFSEDNENLKNSLVYLIEMEIGKVKKLDISKKNAYKWVQHIRVAPSFSDQNLILSQQGRALFFTTTKVVHCKQELKVWYSMHYAKRHRLPLLQPVECNVAAPPVLPSVWQCFDCKEHFESSEELQYHLSIHGLSNLPKICKNSFNQQLMMHHPNHLRTCNSSRNKRYSCEICGYSFSSLYSRNRHNQRHHKTKTKDIQSPLLQVKNNLFPSNGEYQKKKKTEWFCTYCNITFDNPSNCNLHTLAHAAENLEETEVIVGLPHDLGDVLKHRGIHNPDYRCPKCTKRVESVGNSGYPKCEISKLASRARSVDVRTSSLSRTLTCNNANMTFNLNGHSNFIHNKGIHSEEFLAQSPGDSNQINSVFNSFKMQELVMGENERSVVQIRHSPPAQSDEKLSGTLALKDITLAMQQQQNDLLHQTLLTTPLNGGLSDTVARLSQSLLNDNVKISIMDSNLESVAEYSDILMDTSCVANVMGNSNSENDLIEESSVVCSDFEPSNLRKYKKETKDLDSSPSNIEIESAGMKIMSNIENSNSFDSGCFSSHFQAIEDKSTFSLALSSLPVSYLTISRLPYHKSEDHAYGVFARKTISKRTQFGPIEGFLVDEHVKDEPDVLLQRLQDTRNLVLTVESGSGIFQKLDISQGKSSFWMQFVRSAPSFKEQNVILSQQGKSLYFTTTKTIYPKQELRVWYSLPYATKRNLPVLQPGVFAKRNLEGADKSWPCFECSEKFPCSEGLQIHLNIHDFERDENESLDKQKIKKNNRSFWRKGFLHFSRKFKSSSEKHEGYPYQCSTCNRTFPRNYNLKRHQLLHAKDKKFFCEISGYQFSHLYRDRHSRKRLKDISLNGGSKSLSSFLKKKLGFKSNSQKGNDSIEWFCTHCNLTFDNSLVLNLHTLSHGIELKLESENLQCPQCLKEFFTKKELIDHVADHGKLLSQRRLRNSLNPAKPWKCELCYKSFATEDRLQRHMLVHGAEESKPLQCDICYKRFLNNSALACHIKIHTAEKKMFECPICKIVFDQVLSLKEHVHTHSVDGLYTCPQCNKVFDGYSLIRKHIRAFHSDRKHTCNYCGKLFPKLDKLRMHMLRHSDHREFLCANCGKQFKRKDKLKEHMKRMHSAERELRLAMKPHRPPAAKKFMPKVSPTDYHRFIYKCHTCLLGFKRRGMLVNHLAKRHPDISPDSVPELNLPILKTTRDYYCQYCEKVYKSSSKRKAHILKIHPGAELPMSNRRKGGVPEIPGLPNPTFSQTVGSITTHPHACPWCHKQYASKAKLLQHQRKKHFDLLPQSQQLTHVDDQDPSCPPEEQQLILPPQSALHQSECALAHLQGIENVINIIPGGYISTTDDDLREFQESGIIIDTGGLERPLKVLPDGISADLLSQAMSELTNEFRVTVGTSPNDHFLRIVQTSPGHITVTQAPGSPDNQDKEPLSCVPVNAVIGDSSSLSPSPVTNQTSSHLHQLLSESYSLPSSPSQSPSPQTWSHSHVTYTPFTAR